MGTVELVNAGKSHWYRRTDNGARVPGVTTLTGAGMPKPGLMKWYAEVVAAYAVDHREELALMGPVEAYKFLCKVPHMTSGKAAVRGSTVHGIADRLSHGETVDIPDGLEGYVQSAVAFLKEFDFQVWYTEVVVHDAEDHGWAGKIDAIGTLMFPELPEYDRYDRDDDGRIPALIDYKTKAGGIWGDDAYQLGPYRWAKKMILHDGTEIDMPQVSFTGGVHLTPDGYSLIPLETPKSVYRDFLHLKEVARIVEQARDLAGPAIIPPYTNTYELREVTE